MKSWSKKFARVCATSLLALSAIGSLLGPQALAQTAAEKKSAIALIDAADEPQWQKWTQENGWRVIIPATPDGKPDAKPDARAGLSPDMRIQAVAAAVDAAIQAGTVDPAHIYLGGRADSSSAVFYGISRLPDMFAAGVALGGSPKIAVDSGRVFAANFARTPVLWVAGLAGDEELAAKLKAMGLNIEWRNPTGLSNTTVFEWLAAHTRDAMPRSVDCETTAPAFARCFWVQPTKFDAAERNDVLPSTRLSLGSGSTLDLGNFGFRLDEPGPGVLVSYLAEKYNGPLKVNDRLIELDGKTLANARELVDMLSKIYDERRVVVLVQRGKDQVRLETHVVPPEPDNVVSSRVQGVFDPEEKTIQIISRTVIEMRLNIPQEWLPGDLYWNGLSLENVTKPGCYLLTINQELLNAAPCSQ